MAANAGNYTSGKGSENAVRFIEVSITIIFVSIIIFSAVVLLGI
jgi:hypothetical protein